MLNDLNIFRQTVYNFFQKDADSLLDLVDALAGNQHATSVVRLCLEPIFKRSYSTINKAIECLFDNNLQTPKKLTKLLQDHMPSCHVLATDVTPIKRVFAKTLEEKCFIHYSTDLKSQTPISIGHHYRLVWALAEKGWTLPLSVKRVKPFDSRTLVGVDQLKEILEYSKQDWIHVADADYSGGEPLKKLDGFACVSLIRLRNNRVLYFPSTSVKHLGRPKIYGEKFYLNNPPPAEEKVEEGSHRIYKIERWKNLLIKGIHVLVDVVRINIYKDHKPVYPHPIWLAIVGQKDIGLVHALNCYKSRFDVEHFLRFGKRRLLLNSFQTPKVENEENWMWICCLSYWMLYETKDYAKMHPFPWEKKAVSLPTPSLVQRDYSALLKGFELQSCFPKRRGKSPGRSKGIRILKRKQLDAVKKCKTKHPKTHPPP